MSVAEWGLLWGHWQAENRGLGSVTAPYWLPWIAHAHRFSWENPQAASTRQAICSLYSESHPLLSSQTQRTHFKSQPIVSPFLTPSSHSAPPPPLHFTRSKLANGGKKWSLKNYLLAHAFNSGGRGRQLSVFETSLLYIESPRTGKAMKSASL